MLDSHNSSQVMQQPAGIIGWGPVWTMPCSSSTAIFTMSMAASAMMVGAGVHTSVSFFAPAALLSLLVTLGVLIPSLIELGVVYAPSLGWGG